MGKKYTENIKVGANGHLWVEDCDCVELADQFGTPLYVVSENQFRLNYRNLEKAFSSRYPGKIELLFANKSNNNPAIRRILNQEGAGGDCFGVGELYLSLVSGADTKKMVLNGSNKTEKEIEMAVRAGVNINLDALDELDIVDQVSRRLGEEADVGIRVRLELKKLENREATPIHGEGSIAETSRVQKFGMTLTQSISMVKRIQQMKNLCFKELHYHLGRVTNNVDDFAEMAREMVQWSAGLQSSTGCAPSRINLGGGIAYGRPEGHGPFKEDDEKTPGYEDYAEAILGAIKEECSRHSLELPTIRLESGRGIAQGTAITIGRVGAVKEWPGNKKWANLDVSTNHIMRILTSHWYHHIVAVNKAGAECKETYDVVGPLCIPDELGHDRKLPSLERGDLLAVLDTGAYAETTASNFNAQQRPATVLVCGSTAELITERERLSSVIGRYKVPVRLLNSEK